MILTTGIIVYGYKDRFFFTKGDWHSFLWSRNNSALVISQAQLHPASNIKIVPVLPEQKLGSKFLVVESKKRPLGNTFHLKEEALASEIVMEVNSYLENPGKQAMFRNACQLCAMSFSDEEIIETLLHNTKLQRLDKSKQIRMAARVLRTYNVNIAQLGSKLFKFLDFIVEGQCEETIHFLLEVIPPEELTVLLRKRISAVKWKASDVKRRVELLRAFGIKVDGKYLFQGNGPMKISAELTEKRMMSLVSFVGKENAKLMVQRQFRILTLREETVKQNIDFWEKLVGEEEARKILVSCPNALAGSPLKRDAIIDGLSQVFGSEASHLMIRKCPAMLCCDWEANISQKVDFVLYKMKRKKEELVKYPSFFTHSLQRKIEPRFESLRRAGINHEEFALGTFLKLSDSMFKQFLLKEKQKRKSQLRH